MLGLFQPPRATQVDYSQSIFQRFGHQRPGNVMWGGQEEQLNPLLRQCWPRKWLQLITAISRKSRKPVRQIRRTLGFAPAVTWTAQQHRRVHPRMMEKHAC